MSRADSFAKGAGILALAGLVSRVLGAIYRIPLARLLGEEGIGLFQLAYPLYSTLLVISTAGFPVAISKMVAEREAFGDRRGSVRILWVSVAALCATGLACAAALYLGSSTISSSLYHDPRARLSLIALSPAVLLLSVAACFRGFFQGLRWMWPSAASQIFEQVTRASTMIAAAALMASRPLYLAVAWVSSGAALGASVGLVCLLICYLSLRAEGTRSVARGSGPIGPTNWTIMVSLATIGLPIALGTLVIPVSQVLDSVVVPYRLLASDFSKTVAVSLYGQLTGMALVLAYFPTVVTSALAASLVPSVSGYLARRDLRGLSRQVDYALRVALVLALPAAAGLCALAPVITEVLFGSAQAGVPLRILSIGTVFICLQQTCSGVLQGAGAVALPVRNLVIGSLLKVALSLLLTTAQFGISGAAWASVAGFGLSAILSLRDVGRVTGFGLAVVHSVMKPAIGVACMLPVVIGLFRWTLAVAQSTGVALAISVSLGALAYLSALLAVGGIAREDLEMIPRVGPALAATLVRAGLIRV